MGLESIRGIYLYLEIPDVHKPNLRWNTSAKAELSAFYRAAWRWHFYAGLYVVPFLLMLAITGLIMVYGNSIETRFGEKHFVAASGEQQSVVAQAKAAEAAIPGGKVTMYVAPATPDRSSIFAVETEWYPEYCGS